MFLLSYCRYSQREKNVFGEGISRGQSSGQLGALIKTSGASFCSAKPPSLFQVIHIYISCGSWALAEDTCQVKDVQKKLSIAVTGKQPTAGSFFVQSIWLGSERIYRY